METENEKPSSALDTLQRGTREDLQAIHVMAAASGMVPAVAEFDTNHSFNAFRLRKLVLVNHDSDFIPK